MREPSDIEIALEPLLAPTPYELVWVEISKGGKRTVVRVFIDKSGGITLDDITEATKKISAFLDVEMPQLGNYVLEVSSPGLNRPLMKPGHFKPYVTEKISVHLMDALEGRRNFKGVLKSVSEDGIELIVEDEIFSFAFEDIDKARVVPDIRIGSRHERQNNEH